MKKVTTTYFPQGRVSPKMFLLALTVLIIINSCRDDSTISTEYLVSYKQESVLLLPVITTLFETLGTEYPGASDILARAQHSVQVYSITYKTKYKGSDITASGLVCLPLTGEQFPVISFQNGTNTLDANAPTADPLDFNYVLLQAMASNGYIMLIPDYIGFGASEELIHPYYNRAATDIAVADMMHACNELVEQQDILAKSNGRHYLMGYSQGGWATLSAHDAIENGGLSSLEIVASSCGAGAYDMMTMSSYLLEQETFPGPLYLPYFIYARQQYGTLTDPLDKFFKEPYVSRIPVLFDGSYDNSEINEQLTDTIANLVSDDLRLNFLTGASYQSLREVLVESSVSAWNTDGLINLYHGTADRNVPVEQSASLYESFLLAGAGQQVNYFELTGLTHETGLVPWGILTINWFNSLEGK
jgi:hypothetical protein